MQVDLTAEGNSKELCDNLVKVEKISEDNQRNQRNLDFSREICEDTDKTISPTL